MKMMVNFDYKKYTSFLLLIFLSLLFLTLKLNDRPSTTEYEIVSSAATFKDAIAYARINQVGPFVYDLVSAFNFTRIYKISPYYFFRLVQLFLGLFEIYTFFLILIKLKVKRPTSWLLLFVTGPVFFSTIGEFSPVFWLGLGSVVLLYYGYKIFSEKEANFFDFFAVCAALTVLPMVSFSSYAIIFGFDIAVLTLLLIQRRFSKIWILILLQVFAVDHFFAWPDVVVNYFDKRWLVFKYNTDVASHLSKLFNFDPKFFAPILIIVLILCVLGIVLKSVSNFRMTAFVLIFSVFSLLAITYYPPLGRNLNVEIFIFYPLIFSLLAGFFGNFNNKVFRLILTFLSLLNFVGLSSTYSILGGLVPVLLVTTNLFILKSFMD